MNDRIYQYYIDNLVNTPATCKFSIDESQCIDSIFAIMVEVLSNTHPQQNNKIYDAIISACQSNMTSTQQQWLRLYLAIGNRDIEKIRTATTIMLDETAYKSKAQKRYLISALFVSLIASNDGHKVLELWAQYKEDVEESNSRVSFTMTLLLAIADKTIEKECNDCSTTCYCSVLI